MLGKSAIIAALVLSANLAAIDTREPAPSFNAKTLSGETFTKESLKGRVVLVQFWTTWCRYCRAEQPGVDAIDREFADQGLVVLAVNVKESKKTVTDYLEKSPRSCKVVLSQDTNLIAQLAPDSFPHYVVIDRAGKIAGVQRGAGGPAALRELLSHAGLRSK